MRSTGSGRGSSRSPWSRRMRARQAQSLDVAGRQRQRALRGVDGVDGGVRQASRQGDGYRAAAGANVGDGAGAARSDAKSFVDEQLRLRPWDEGVRRHLQVDAVELLVADDVGGRFVGEAALDEALERGAIGLRRCALAGGRRAGRGRGRGRDAGGLRLRARRRRCRRRGGGTARRGALPPASHELLLQQTRLLARGDGVD